MHNLVRSFKHAGAGIIYCFKTQRNMGIHAAAGLLALIMAYVLHVEKIEMMLLLTAVFAVVGAEVFNTAIEKAVDVATRDKNDLAHIAKDVAAGAVLLAAVFSILVGLFVFVPPLWEIVSGHLN